MLRRLVSDPKLKSVLPFSHSHYILKNSSKSVHKFLSYLADKRTDRQTNGKKKHNLFGGGNRHILKKIKIPTTASQQHTKVWTLYLT